MGTGELASAQVLRRQRTRIGLTIASRSIAVSAAATCFLLPTAARSPARATIGAGVGFTAIAAVSFHQWRVLDRLSPEDAPARLAYERKQERTERIQSYPFPLFAAAG